MANDIVRKYGMNKRFIEPLSPSTNTDVSPADAVTAFGVPLSDFDNEVINDLYRDMYWQIYLANPQLKETPPVGRQENRALIEWVLNDAMFGPRTMFATNRKLVSAATAHVVVEELMELEPVSVAMQQSSDADDLDDEADRMEDESGQGSPQPSNEQDDEQSSGDDEQNSAPDDQDSGGDSGEDDSNNDEQDSGSDQGPYSYEDIEPGPEQKRDKANDLRDKAQENIESVVGSGFQDFNRTGAVNSGADFGSEVMSFLQSWGVDGDDTLMLDPETLYKIMEMLTVNDIGMLLQMMGRVFGIAMRTLSGRSPVEVQVDQGGFTKEIMSLHPAELYKLTPMYAGRKQAIEDWMIRGLAGVKKTSVAKYEGNFICIEDQSSSMGWRTDDGYMRKEVAKALALGLAKAARVNGQEFYLAGFGHENQFTDLITSRTPLPKLLDWAIKEFHGGH